MKKLLLSLCITVGVLGVSIVKAEQAILAGGCFWCMEYDFEKIEGVTDVVSGFTGGSHPNPTYNGDHTGHYEAIRVTYDPEVLSYQDILNHFWVNIDPFDSRGQFCDKGHSYLSAIFVANDEQRELAEKSKAEVAAMFSKQKIVTPILDQSTFFPIKGEESYHQDYYKKNPLRYKLYRWNCGRDVRLQDIWGLKATKSL